MKDFEWVDVNQEDPPELGHWYDILRYNWVTTYLFETLGKWNGFDWFNVNNKSITSEVRYWKKKGK